MELQLRESGRSAHGKLLLATLPEQAPVVLIHKVHVNTTCSHKAYRLSSLQVYMCLCVRYVRNTDTYTETLKFYVRCVKGGVSQLLRIR